MDRVRDVDLPPYTNSKGEVWAKAANGGVSTFETKGEATKKWWKLPSGSAYDDTLLLVCDGPGHWLWEPKQDMLMSDYKAALAAVNPEFIRV